MAASQPGYGKSKPKSQTSAASAAPRAMQSKMRMSPLRLMEKRMRQMHGFGMQTEFSGRRGALKKKR